MYKIIGADGREYGPISAEQVRQWFREGRLNATSRIQAEGASQWNTLAELPEFSAALPVAPAPIAMAGPPVSRSNPLAVWALVTGVMSLFCCCGILAPVSIILGAIALSQISHNPGQSGKGLAIAGLAIGCFVLVLNLIAGIAAALNPNLLDTLKNALNQQ